MKQVVFAALRWVFWLLTGDHMKAFILFCAIVAASLFAAKEGDRGLHINTWLNPQIELVEYAFTREPDDWVKFEDARQIFVERYCSAQSDFTGKTCDEIISLSLEKFEKAGLQWARARAREIDALEKEDRALSDQCEKGLFHFCDFILANDYANADLRGSFMVGLNLKEARLNNADLTNAVMEAVTATEADFTGASLQFARLQGAILNGARLGGADLRSARLTGALFKNAFMAGANLAGSDMSDAYYSASDLSGANLFDVDVSGAAFQDTEFTQSTSNILTLLFSILTGNSGVSEGFLLQSFGDGSVKFASELEAPAHWPKERLTNEAFLARWRGWREEQGFHLPPAGAVGDLLREVKATPPSAEVMADEIEILDDVISTCDLIADAGLPVSWDAISSGEGVAVPNQTFGIHFRYALDNYASADLTANVPSSDVVPWLSIYEIGSDGKCNWVSADLNFKEKRKYTADFEVRRGSYFVKIDREDYTDEGIYIKVATHEGD